MRKNICVDVRKGGKAKIGYRDALASKKGGGRCRDKRRWLKNGEEKNCGRGGG